MVPRAPAAGYCKLDGCLPVSSSLSNVLEWRQIGTCTLFNCYPSPFPPTCFSHVSADCVTTKVLFYFINKRHLFRDIFTHLNVECGDECRLCVWCVLSHESSCYLISGINNSHGVCLLSFVFFFEQMWTCQFTRWNEGFCIQILSCHSQKLNFTLHFWLLLLSFYWLTMSKAS